MMLFKDCFYQLSLLFKTVILFVVLFITHQIDKTILEAKLYYCVEIF